MSFARITLAGTLLQEPEKRFTQNNQAVTILQLAVPMPPRRNDNEPQQMVVKIVCWRIIADAVANLQQGTVVQVEGRLQIAKVTTPEGVQKSMFEVDAQTVYQLPGLPQLLRGDMAQQGGGSGYAPQPQHAAPSYAQQPQQYQASSAGMPQPTQPMPIAVAAPAQQANFSDLSADDFLTEDDIPF